MLVLPAVAADFDSIDPPYGQELATLDNSDYFVKYMEKGPVSYYNYIGPRQKDPIYEHSSPHMVYAFVEGKLYARIVRNWGNEKSEILSHLKETFGEPSKSYEEDIWSIFQWDALKGKDITFKLKFNNQTKEVKTAHYYNPLRKVAGSVE
jgi:hypothetical protein